MAVPVYSTKMRFPQRVILPMHIVRSLGVRRTIVISNKNQNLDDGLLDWLKAHETYGEWFESRPKKQAPKASAKKAGGKRTVVRKTSSKAALTIVAPEAETQPAE